MATQRYEFETGPSGPRLSVVAPEPRREADAQAEQQAPEEERKDVGRRRLSEILRGRKARPPR